MHSALCDFGLPWPPPGDAADHRCRGTTLLANTPASPEQDPPQAESRLLITTWLFPVYRWLVVAPFLVLSTFLLGSLIIVVSLLGFPDFASRVFGRLWARLNMFVSMIRIEVQGHQHMEPGQSYIVVANHQSLIDIYVLYGYLDTDIKWVMKKELRAVPVLGIACELMGHIIIDRSDTQSALESINSARDRIRDGISAVFFPEGTRSRSGALKPFKRGAFRLAVELGLPLLPVTISDTCKVLPSDTTALFPGRVTLRIHPAVSTEGKSAETARELAEQCKQIIGRNPDAREPRTESLAGE